MDEANKRAVDEVIENLNRIPKNIDTEIIVKDIMKEINERMKRENRRYNSYV